MPKSEPAGRRAPAESLESNVLELQSPALMAPTSVFATHRRWEGAKRQYSIRAATF
jgi:hypothetical protein